MHWLCEAQGVQRGNACTHEEANAPTNQTADTSADKVAAFVRPIVMYCVRGCPYYLLQRVLGDPENHVHKLRAVEGLPVMQEQETGGARACRVRAPLCGVLFCRFYTTEACTGLHDQKA